MVNKNNVNGLIYRFFLEMQIGQAIIVRLMVFQIVATKWLKRYKTIFL